jgi:hypothetical protein
MIYIATITDIHLNEDGLVVFAASDEANNSYYPCAMTTPLGGYDGRFSQPSLKEGTKVVLIAYGTGYIRSYYAISYLLDPEDSLAVNVDGVRTALEAEAASGRMSRTEPDVADARTAYDKNTDYEGSHVEDLHIEVQDSFMNISTEHGLVLQGEPRVSVQIPEDASRSAFRVSAGGNANNFVLNAAPHLNRLFDYIGTLEKKITQLETAMNSMAPGVVASYEAAAAAADLAAPGSGLPIREQSTTMSTALAEAAALGPLTPATEVREQSDQDVNAYVIIP